MKLFKMRSLGNLEYVIDIIFNERLYCAHFADLNDPFEGIYLAGSGLPHGLPQRDSINELPIEGRSAPYRHQESNRICSLSESFEDVRLWSYYGDGHRGIAIEIDFQSHEADLKPIHYMKDFTDYENANSEMPSIDEILSQKTVHWQYERECRIVQPEPFYSIKNRIAAIYLGSRISRDRQALMEKLVPESIPIYATKINIGKLAVEPHDLLARTPRK